MASSARAKLSDSSGNAAAAAARSPADPDCSSFRAASRISKPLTLADAPLMECATNRTVSESWRLTASANREIWRGAYHLRIRG